MNTTVEGKVTLLSKKGMKELKKSISQLEHDRAQALLALREQDKTSAHDERFTRADRIAAIDMIEAELEEKRYTLSRAKLAPKQKGQLRVAIGSVVDLIDKQGRKLRFQIVDTLEANPSDGRISAASPLGQSLIGKTVMDIVKWSTNATTNQLRLIRIT
ncbi:MAG TPA: GreA/GreB family elongation factor [Candidatus Saccharibacteria bacterium]|nr:GreA/GreB family elongation factor [Candidatus Saccharibacteria bacterium]HRN97653.1 GreA/GreB family elongation factor [Candidatus Saccharibacteria bacterium]HRQ06758.1 GreA/GreB family elongation factor [Candidatus Saccharibacteria bacterium]HRQ97885.1 GreA/GreB family elongation factor [Candidatus Saccharibacteria bacterium]